MKYYSLCDPEFDCRIRRSIEVITQQYQPALPDGWAARVILREVRQKSRAHDYFDLAARSEQGGGEYAETKILTLKNCPQRLFTGYATLAELKADLDHIHLPRPILGAVYGELDKATSIAQLSPKLHEILRTQASFTIWHGGLRIPYRCRVFERVIDQDRKAKSKDEKAKSKDEKAKDRSKSAAIREERGEILVAFSGAKEWIDVALAYQIAAQVQDAMDELWLQDQITYQLPITAGCQSDPVIRFWNISSRLRPYSKVV